MNRRIRYASVHLLVSAVIAGIAAALVFFLWYPSPYATLSGGLGLFGLLVGIDVVLGPMLTAVVASEQKRAREIGRDIAVIALLQALAFGYGFYTIASARPVYTVFEVDRLRVLRAIDLDPKALESAAPEFQQLSWTGPRLLSVHLATSQAELLKSVELALGGLDAAMRPERWAVYEADKTLKAGRPVATLLAKYPALSADIHAAVEKSGVPVDSLVFLPITSHKHSWVVLMAGPDARIVACLEVDGFF